MNASPVYHALKRSPRFRSGDYWDKRYQKGGTSGDGSYGKLAKFKAEFLNDFVRQNKLSSVIELGCGDGNQLRLFQFDNYVGLDVSKTSVKMCATRFNKDKTKSFFLYDPNHFVDNAKIFSADLALSLDVIYHLVEDEVFEKYMHDLFNTAKKYVVVYSSNHEDNNFLQAQHVRHRKFSEWVKAHKKEWSLEKIIPNKYPMGGGGIQESSADFFIYQRKQPVLS